MLLCFMYNIAILYLELCALKSCLVPGTGGDLHLISVYITSGVVLSFADQMEHFPGQFNWDMMKS